MLKQQPLLWQSASVMCGKPQSTRDCTATTEHVAFDGGTVALAAAGSRRSKKRRSNDDEMPQERILYV